MILYLVGMLRRKAGTLGVSDISSRLCMECMCPKAHYDIVLGRDVAKEGRNTERYLEQIMYVSSPPIYTYFQPCS
jgi:hypothetical protein